MYILLTRQKLFNDTCIVCVVFLFHLVVALMLDVLEDFSTSYSVQDVWSLLLLSMRLDMLWGSCMSSKDLTEMIISTCTEVRVSPFLNSANPA